jgi:predicted amidohydrolase YtcJ
MREIDKEIPIRDKRFVIEHAEFPTPEQMAECQRLGIIPTTATNFIWGKGAEVYQERLGKEYAQQAIPLRAWLDAVCPSARVRIGDPGRPSLPYGSLLPGKPDSRRR